jgi:GNAT superfamily N-acetyltransferase
LKSAQLFFDLHQPVGEMNQMTKTIIADLYSADHGQDIVRLLDEYASHPMGGGQPLAEYTKTNLISELARLEQCVVIITYAKNEAAALAICFEGFSTFACRPILNIHDLLVSRKFRGQGLAVGLLEKAESVARKRSCCKMTLEVLEGNHRASKVYQEFGFCPYELDPELGSAVFYQKKL